MYCTKDAGRREHWFLLRTDLSNPVLCIAVSRRKGPVTVTKRRNDRRMLRSPLPSYSFEVLDGINIIDGVGKPRFLQQSRLLP